MSDDNSSSSSDSWIKIHGQDLHQDKDSSTDDLSDIEVLEPDEDFSQTISRQNQPNQSSAPETNAASNCPTYLDIDSEISTSMQKTICNDDLKDEIIIDNSNENPEIATGEISCEGQPDGYLNDSNLSENREEVIVPTVTDSYDESNSVSTSLTTSLIHNSQLIDQSDLSRHEFTYLIERLSSNLRLTNSSDDLSHTDTMPRRRCVSTGVENFHEPARVQIVRPNDGESLPESDAVIVDAQDSTDFDNLDMNFVLNGPPVHQNDAIADQTSGTHNTALTKVSLFCLTLAIAFALGHYTASRHSHLSVDFTLSRLQSEQIACQKRQDDLELNLKDLRAQMVHKNYVDKWESLYQEGETERKALKDAMETYRDRYLESKDVLSKCERALEDLKRADSENNNHKKSELVDQLRSELVKLRADNANLSREMNDSRNNFSLLVIQLKNEVNQLRHENQMLSQKFRKEMYRPLPHTRNHTNDQQPHHRQSEGNDKSIRRFLHKLCYVNASESDYMEENLEVSDEELRLSFCEFALKLERKLPDMKTGGTSSTIHKQGNIYTKMRRRQEFRESFHHIPPSIPNSNSEYEEDEREEQLSEEKDEYSYSCDDSRHSSNCGDNSEEEELNSKKARLRDILRCFHDAGLPFSCFFDMRKWVDNVDLLRNKIKNLMKGFNSDEDEESIENVRVDLWKCFKHNVGYYKGCVKKVSQIKWKPFIKGINLCVDYNLADMNYFLMWIKGDPSPELFSRHEKHYEGLFNCVYHEVSGIL